MHIYYMCVYCQAAEAETEVCAPTHTHRHCRTAHKQTDTHRGRKMCMTCLVWKSFVRPSHLFAKPPIFLVCLQRPLTFF